MDKIYTSSNKHMNSCNESCIFTFSHIPFFSLDFFNYSCLNQSLRLTMTSSAFSCSHFCTTFFSKILANQRTLFAHLSASIVFPTQLRWNLAPIPMTVKALVVYDIYTSLKIDIGALYLTECLSTVLNNGLKVKHGGCIMCSSGCVCFS